VRKILIPVLLLALTGMTPLFALDVTLIPPKFGGAPAAIIDPINQLIAGIFRQYENEIGNDLRDIEIDSTKLVNAFANSSVFASTGAAQRGYIGYDRFAVTIGAMGGIMNPGNIFSFAGEVNNITKNVEELNDIDIGFNPQILNAQIGFNTSFLLNNLYLGLKLGFFSLDSGQITFTTPSIGLMANYQLIPQIRIPTGIILWRGINLGTGIIYQYTDMEIGIPLPSKREQINILNLYSTSMLIDSKLILKFVENTFTVPLEATTSLRLLSFLNLSLGLGADLGFGIADFKLTGEATATFEGLPDFLTPAQAPGLTASTGGTNSPDLFNPKLMASLGFSIGPVIIDIPVTYYFLNNGYNFGITLGFIL
jgi:hypothetical protein